MLMLTKSEVAAIKNGELSESLYERVFDFLSDNGVMPYGIQKAVSGDPYEFVLEYLTKTLKGI